MGGGDILFQQPACHRRTTQCFASLRSALLCCLLLPSAYYLLLLVGVVWSKRPQISPELRNRGGIRVVEATGRPHADPEGSDGAGEVVLGLQTARVIEVHAVECPVPISVTKVGRRRVVEPLHTYTGRCHPCLDLRIRHLHCGRNLTLVQIVAGRASTLASVVIAVPWKRENEFGSWNAQAVEAIHACLYDR